MFLRRALVLSGRERMFLRRALVLRDRPTSPSRPEKPAPTASGGSGGRRPPVTPPRGHGRGTMWAMSTIEGYVYVPDSDPGVFAGAGPGTVVRTPSRSPPWIVVHHALHSILVTRWPGRLWRAAVVDAHGVEQGLLFSTRAVAVKILEEVPVWRLFGDHGEAVAAILSFASRLDASTAERLAAHRHPEADQAYERSFRRWYESVGDALGTPGNTSPIKSAFIDTVVGDRAGAVAGRSAFIEVEVDDAIVVGEDPEVEYELAPPWDGASSALSDAAIALGAPSFAAEDADILLTAWRAVADPGNSPPPIEGATDGR